VTGNRERLNNFRKKNQSKSEAWKTIKSNQSENEKNRDGKRKFLVIRVKKI
jgi:hypothetical protein